MQTKKLVLGIGGLSCGGGGALEIERALAGVPGVIQVYVNPATEEAYIECDAASFNLRTALEAIWGLGYRASDDEASASNRERNAAGAA